MKIKKLILLTLISLALIPSCDILKQMVTFTKCEFKMNSLTNTKLVGVNIQNKSKFKQLSLIDITNVTKSLLSGKLPLTFDLNIEAKNPNATAASMHKMEWKVFIDGIEITQGIMDQKVAIEPGGSQIIPLQVSIDLKKALSGKTKDALLNFGFNLADKGNYPTRVRLDIKPTVYVGGITLQYPGYFSLKKEFGSN